MRTLLNAAGFDFTCRALCSPAHPSMLSFRPLRPGITDLVPPNTVLVGSLYLPRLLPTSWVDDTMHIFLCCCRCGRTIYQTNSAGLQERPTRASVGVHISCTLPHDADSC
jgi:hypothetical protein